MKRVWYIYKLIETVHNENYLIVIFKLINYLDNILT